MDRHPWRQGKKVPCQLWMAGSVDAGFDLQATSNGQRVEALLDPCALLLGADFRHLDTSTVVDVEGRKRREVLLLRGAVRGSCGWLADWGSTTQSEGYIGCQLKRFQDVDVCGTYPASPPSRK